MNNQTLGLAVLALGGFVVYTMMKKKGAEEEAGILSEPLPPTAPPSPDDVAIQYGEAISDWNERLVGETLPNGDKIFQPLDISRENPLRLYYAIVKKKSVVDPTVMTSVRYVDVGEIYLFNTATNREVRVDELAKQQTMTQDAILATEETFGNAFADSCRINPQYNPWTGKVSSGFTKAGVAITSNNREYWRGKCAEVYKLGL